MEMIARALQCPVLPTWGGRGALPESDPQVLVYSSPPANAAIAAADVVLAIGTSIGETVHYGEGHHWAQGNSERKWIYVERDRNNIGVNRPIDVPLVGDLHDVLPQLQRALQRHPARVPLPALATWRSELVELRSALFAAAPDTYPIHPGRMIREATQDLPADTVIVRDGGCTALWELAYHEIRSRDYLWTSKFGHLGTGLPYAIGAQLAVGDSRRVCLITGDSAFQFHISELETAVRKQLPIVVIVNSDAAWGMERPGFEMAFGPDSDVEVRWGEVRLDKIAEGYGAYGQYVDRTEEIAPAVKRAFASGRTAVVQVAVDPKVNALEAPNWAEFATWYGHTLY
jgi:thiamine pyrophosphate-dependent acetolactate synthase large subunit-like protein